MKAIGYLVENANFIPCGEYKRTELDDYKASVDFLITFCGRRHNEVIFNKPTIIIKTGRGVEATGSGIYKNRAYLVTDKALDMLKRQYTWSTDF
ncbi:MAG: hypothetical protein IJ762_11805 [Bacteroidaceae bacterium]|nr:hypothetical protein [Bacteroidaceae bacterium]